MLFWGYGQVISACLHLGLVDSLSWTCSLFRGCTGVTVMTSRFCLGPLLVISRNLQTRTCACVGLSGDSYADAITPRSNWRLQGKKASNTPYSCSSIKGSMIYTAPSLRPAWDTDRLKDVSWVNHARLGQWMAAGLFSDTRSLPQIVVPCLTQSTLFCIVMSESHLTRSAWIFWDFQLESWHHLVQLSKSTPEPLDPPAVL